jgi:calmodulin
MKLTDAQVSATLKKVDKDSDGVLSFPEFLNVMEHQPKQTQSEAYLIAAFKAYDTNGDGFITRQELRETMAKTGETLSEADLSKYASLTQIPAHPKRKHD